MRYAARLAIAANLASIGAFAQTAQVTGRVTDSSGAVIPGAKIAVTSVATGVDRGVDTNSAGYYTVPLLLPGEYRIGVEREGFKSVLRSGVVLGVDQQAEFNRVGRL